MNIIDCKQGTPEWLAARLGKVTASEIGALVSPLGKVRTGDGPRTYLYKKLAEKILGVPGSDFTSFGMEQGVIVESEARAWFAFENNVSVREVGFCESDDGHIGFSPDGLIGEDGGIEIKSPQPAKHIEYLLNGVVPEDYVLQVQFSLYVSGRAWWKFLSYSRQFPALVVHVEPDAKLQAAIGTALEIFRCGFDASLTRITAMKSAHEDPRREAYEAKIAAWEAGGPIPS
jgi:hypothetical protein